MNDIQTCLNSISDHFRSFDNAIKNMETRNSSLVKVVATIRQNLERGIKNPKLLNQAVYDSIDLCRANFSYMDYSSGQIKTDPPLSEEEKTLP